MLNNELYVRHLYGFTKSVWKRSEMYLFRPVIYPHNSSCTALKYKGTGQGSGPRCPQQQMLWRYLYECVYLWMCLFMKVSIYESIYLGGEVWRKHLRTERTLIWARRVFITSFLLFVRPREQHYDEIEEKYLHTGSNRAWNIFFSY